MLTWGFRGLVSHPVRSVGGMEAVCDPVASEAFDQLDGCLDMLRSAGVIPCDARDAAVWIRRCERARRRLDAVQALLVSAIDDGRLHGEDGHYSPTAMIEHHGGLSRGEAAARARTARMLSALPLIDQRYSTGALGVDHVRLLAKVYANKRVRDHMADAQGWFLDQADGLSFRDFAQVVRTWEQLLDADGTRDRNQHNHDTRNATLTQDAFDLGWELRASMSSLVGAELAAILDAYTTAEYEIDWDKARAEHGDAATAAHLPRTPAQRRNDALVAIFHDAANSTLTLAKPVVHNIVWTDHAYRETLQWFETGQTPDFDIDRYRCSTLNGTPVEPCEAAANSMWNHMRRVLVDTKAVTIDLGRARSFTGNARHAVLLNNPTCIWPGCHTTATNCQIDHLHEHQHEGRTRPGNGAPLCGRHNRHKHNHHYRIHRDPTGTYTITRPDHTTFE